MSKKSNEAKNADRTKLKMIDLFCGCGGLTKGFIDTGFFEPVWANDNNPESIETYRANFDPSGTHSFLGDIERVVDTAPELIPKADIVIGGPPCQGFSLLNKKRGTHDKRRTLWYQFLRVAEHSEAKVIVMENVPQLLASPEFAEIKERLHELGFANIIAHVLNAANYGVPEARRRAVVIASKIGNVSLPRPTHIRPDKHAKQLPHITKFAIRPWETVRSAIADLPPPKGTDIRMEQAPLDLHFGRTPTGTSLERYAAIPTGGHRFNLAKHRPDITPACWLRKPSGGTDLFGRLWWDRPSVTIRTEFFKPEKGRYLHPEQHRPITHREAARIQSFPDSFRFLGSKIEIARQIGNAVPVLLAKAIGDEAHRALRQEISLEDRADTKELFNLLLGEDILVDIYDENT